MIVLRPEEKQQLEAALRCGKTQRRYAERARMILRCAKGETNRAIARQLGVRPATVSKWRVRFEREGLSGLQDDFRAGRARGRGGADFRARLLQQLDQAPPSGYGDWNGPLLGLGFGSQARPGLGGVARRCAGPASAASRN